MLVGLMERMRLRADLFLDRAREYIEKNDWRGCLKACQMALYCEPSGDLFASTLYLKALALIELGRTEEALFDLNKIEGLTQLYPALASRASELNAQFAKRKSV
jgi:tetratricopeptide (TPR) repeat protein